MASYTTFPMIEQEYVGEKLRKNVEFTFPETPYKSVSVTPDYSTMKDNVSTNAETKTIVGEDTRTIVTKPHLMDYSQCCGRIDAIYIQENSDILIKHATASAFAENWLVTTALNVYNPTVKKFPDKILYFPALGGDIKNPPYPAVNITNAYIQSTMESASPDTQEMFNIAFLKMDESATKPEGYYGFRYQYDSYNGEGAMILGYPNELPADADILDKGTYMYRGMGKIPRSDYNFLWHQGDTSVGYEGAPLYVYWGDGNGWDIIGINAYQESNKNVAIRLNRLIYGAMKMIRDGGMADVRYTQPEKPDNSSMPVISSVFDDLRTLGTAYHTYYGIKHSSIPNVKTCVIGICNFLRQVKYANIKWAAALLDSIDTAFVEYVKESDIELFNRLFPYLDQEEISFKDSGNGVIDLAHFAATLEGHIRIAPAPDFWTGWGGDLATGMADTSLKLQTDYGQDTISNYIITQTAYEVIGNPNFNCNFSDFCSDFDALKISEIIKQNILDDIYKTTPGYELADTLETYYTDLYQDRFQYVFSDLGRTVDSAPETVFNAVYTKMTGPEEKLGLLSTFGKSPSDLVITACCHAFTKYILKEI